MHIPNFWLLAGDPRLEGIARGMRRQVQTDWAGGARWLAILAAMIAIVWLCGRLANRERSAPSSDRPLGLFLALCRVHRLRWSERWTLWRLARRQQLADPARLFLEPDLLNAVRGAPVGERQAQRLADLSERLFAGLESIDIDIRR